MTELTTRWIVLLNFNSDTSDTERQHTLKTLTHLSTDAVHTSAGVHLPGSVGPADATWDVTSTNGKSPLVLPSITSVLSNHAQITSYEALPLTPIAQHTEHFSGPRVKRTLLFRVHDDAEKTQVSVLEEQLLAMPQHIPGIRSWCLSHITPELSEHRWTHAWEQEYASVEDLNGEYLMHPHHWTLVDAHFDAEMPHATADPLIAHVYYSTEGPVLA